MREVRDVDAADLRTVGSDAKHDVVDIGIPGAGAAVGADGHEGSRSGVVAEVGIVFLPYSAVANIDGGDLLEGVGV